MLKGDLEPLSLDRKSSVRSSKFIQKWCKMLILITGVSKKDYTTVTKGSHVPIGRWSQVMGIVNSFAKLTHSIAGQSSYALLPKAIKPKQQSELPHSYPQSDSVERWSAYLS